MSESHFEIGATAAATVAAEQRQPLMPTIKVPFADEEDLSDMSLATVASIDIDTDTDVPATDGNLSNGVDRSGDSENNNNNKENVDNNNKPEIVDTTNASSSSEDLSAIATPPSPPLCSRNLRRNSISMPSGINAIELEALRVLHHQVITQGTLSEEQSSSSGTTIHAVQSVPDNIDDAYPLSGEAGGGGSGDAGGGGGGGRRGAAAHSASEQLNAITTLRYENEQQQQQQQLSAITKATTDDNESDEDEFGRKRKPMQRDRFRSRRRASIAPLPALRLNSKEMLASDFDTHSVASNQASITSINSVASLLREKMQAFPQMIRKKRRETKDYKIKIFVIMMFFSIIFLICYAYIAYHAHILTRSYFDKIKFNSKDRIFSILSHDDRVVISGHLGLTLGYDTAPYHCLEEQRRDDGSVCIEWNGLARLHMNFQDLNVFRCYTLQWQALGAGVYPTDCYAVPRRSGGGGSGTGSGGSSAGAAGGAHQGLWFGGGMTKGIDWALSEANFDYAPFGSGDMNVHQFGNGVKRYFINSVGVALQVNDATPLHVSMNRTENRFCMRAMHDNFTFVNHLVELPQLEYKICTTDDMRSLHMLMTQQSLWDGLKESDIRLLHSLLEEPVWRIPHQGDRDSIDETTIYKYSEAVIALGFMRSWGHLLVNEFWQENIGDFSVQHQRFATLNETIDVLHRRGFKVVFTIQPFVSTDSPNFRDAVREKLLIYERHSERSIPALTRYKSSASAGVLDITKNASVPWLLEKLEALKRQYKVDGFYLDLGTGHNLPHYYQCRQTLLNPDTYLRKFTARLEGIGVMGVSSASVVPKPPAFLSTPPVNATWQGMREMLTSVLLYGVLGYPFVLPGPIGGDYALNRSATKMLSFHSLGQPGLPDPELYVRWLQLATFMPAMQYGHLPSAYGSEQIMSIAKELNDVREKIVVPLLKKSLSDSMNEGLPLVRPLWMLDPHDAACLSASDEFSIGDELIVAPILDETQVEREVYLPQGVWKDGIDGSLRKGSRWMHSYKVPKDKIAYFIKMPDNTRF